MNNFLLLLTSNAHQYLNKVVGPDKALSISLKPSGCSGYSNILKIVDANNEKNLQKFKGINFLLNEENKKYFNNAVIDYKKDGLNYKLIIENPNTRNACGCGESFALNKDVKYG